MNSRNNCPHLFNITEIADLLNHPEGLIRRMVNAKRCPGWIWKPRWKEPRFSESSISEWMRILDQIDLDGLPSNPPPLETPTQVFKRIHRHSDAELELILKYSPLKTAERLRAEP